jgi:endoglucanase Acf2
MYINVCNIGKPYPNGRNEESSSESISAYEAVALYGEVYISLRMYKRNI